MPGILSAIDEMDGDVRGLSFFAEELVGCVLDHVEFEDCTFESCSFSELQAQRLSFDRCTFDGCEFSNARLAKSYCRLPHAMYRDELSNIVPSYHSHARVRVPC